MSDRFKNVLSKFENVSNKFENVLSKFKNMPMWKRLFALTVVILAGVPMAVMTLRPSIKSAPMLEELWRVDGLANPESAVYDPSSGLIYVSNINGDPLAKDGNGSIAVVSAEGELLEPLITKGLNGPKGLALFDNKLFIADIDRLVVVDIVDRVIKEALPVDDVGFLNDVELIPRSPKGSRFRVGRYSGEFSGSLVELTKMARHYFPRLVLMSDTFKDRIYAWAYGFAKPWIFEEGPPLKGPNGLLFMRTSYPGSFPNANFRRTGTTGGCRLFLANWGERTEGFATKTLGALWQFPCFQNPYDTARLERDKSSRLSQSRTTSVTEPFGNLDGIVAYRRDNYIVSDWAAGKLYHVNDKGKVTELAAPGKGSADLGLDQRRGILFVPMMLDNQLIAYKIKERYWW